MSTRVLPCRAFRLLCLVMALLGFTLMSCVARAAPALFDDTKVSAAEQDASGQVWAIADITDHPLLRWDGTHWQAMKLDFAGAAEPLALGRSNKGEVLCLWKKNASQAEGEYFVSAHLGAGGEVKGKFSARLQYGRVRLMGDRAGNVWISGSGKDIYRIAPDGVGALAYSIAPEQYHEFGRPKAGEYAQYHEVLAVEDGQGKVWFWSQTPSAQTGPAKLRGVLIFDGKTFAHHATLDGLPDKPISCLTAKDATHLWATVVEDGLYEIETTTLQATRIATPPEADFHYVQQIFSTRDSEAFFITSAANSFTLQPDGAWRSGAVWRWRDGQWRQLLNGVDEIGGDYLALGRAFLPTPQGLLLLGAFGNSAWLIPDDENTKPRALDWRSGFDLANTNRFFQLEGGRVLAVGADDGSMVYNLQTAGKAKPSGRILQTLKTQFDIFADARGHIWTAQNGSDTFLSEWDGARWIYHRLPLGQSAGAIGNMGADSRGRIWVWLLTKPNSPVWILEPDFNEWQSMPSYLDALAVAVRDDRHFWLREARFVPAFSGDGKVVLRDGEGALQFFDGRSWVTWPRKEITGKPNSTDGEPFFNDQGEPSINVENRIWSWGKETGWRVTQTPGTSWQNRRDAGRKIFQSLAPEELKAGESGNQTTLACDRYGAWWFASRHALFKGRQDLSTPASRIFRPEENHPFYNHSLVAEVLIDPKGNAWVRQTYFGRPMCVVIAPAAPLPDTHLIVKTTGDAATLEFSATEFSSTPAARRFLWRLKNITPNFRTAWNGNRRDAGLESDGADGGAWSTLRDGNQMQLELLPSGKYALEAAALDADGQADPTPARVEFEIHADANAQFARLIGALSDRDFAAREAAVAALAKRGVLALPPLRAAREKADADARWWIDAAIQQLEAQRNK